MLLRARLLCLLVPAAVVFTSPAPAAEHAADGLTAIVNFAAGFDGKVDGGRSDRQEVDLTIDYRVKKEGWMKSFLLRVRGSWLNDESADRDGTDVRVILRYDFPVI